MASSLADLACTVPWCITPEAFEAMISIAEREPLPEDEIARRMHGPQALALRNGQRRDDSGRLTMHGPVATIPIDGPIYRYADYFTKVSGGVTTEQLARDVQTALDDPAVAALMLIIDSPGGEAQGINELADTIYAARDRKPIIAYVEGQAASAAYWIATAASEIVMDDAALVGSIGMVVSVPDPSKRFSRSIDFVSSQSPRKRPDPTTDAGRKDIQAIADALTEVFIEKVARNMNVSAETVARDFGQGGQLVGRYAIAAGMAHRFGSEDRIIQELTRRAVVRRIFPTPPIGIGPIGLTAKLTTYDNREERMKVSEFIAGIFTGAKDAGIELEADAPAPPAPDPTTTTAAVNPTTPDPRADDQAARLAELERQLAEQRGQQIATEAAAFADRAVREHKAFPAERDAIVALYTQAAQDDDAHGVVTFADGQLRARTALLDAEIAARPAHSLSAELIASGPGGILDNDIGPKPMTEERRKALLAMTPLGQAALSKTTRSA